MIGLLLLCAVVLALAVAADLVAKARLAKKAKTQPIEKRPFTPLADLLAGKKGKP